MTDKKELRRLALQRRDAMDVRDRMRWSREIQNRIRESRRYREAGTVLSYASFRSEVSTDQINEWALQDGKRLYLPRTYADRKEMIYYRVTELSSLKPGYQGICEPAQKDPWLPAEGQVEGPVLMLMPGAAFDRYGSRIGYGGGYYDRFLDIYGGWITHKVMLAFAGQQLPKIYRENHDIAPDGIITEIRMEEESMLSIEEIGSRARKASREMGRLGVAEKNHGLEAAAQALCAHRERLMEENRLDVDRARENGMKESLVDRLTLTGERIDGMAEGIRQIISLPDPVGEVVSMKTTPLGMQIGQKRVPLGVVGIIYESRPNVTADAFGLCFKTGNVVILRGGSDAIHSNKAIVEVIREALQQCGLPADSIQLLTDTSHETAERFMRLNEYIDVLIPRGGAGLIRTVVEKSTVPVIETGTGNCHIYVDEYADIGMAVDIIENAKTQRLGVCNACESLVIHSAVAETAIPAIAARLKEHGVEIRGDERARACFEDMEPATEEDFRTEYLDAVISVRVVDTIEEAIDHINEYNTGHSEAIITADYHNAMEFLNEIDAAAVYVNASTRFTDGFEFGFGAEIGISTQKLHARGPMGLLALTTTKYIILGDGQIRK